MNATQRTPQQASIEARAAREAWERGETIDGRLLKTETGWVGYDKNSHPYFTSQLYEWRTKPTPTPTITPGKWMMRNGITVEIKAIEHPEYKWIDTYNTHMWGKDGQYFSNSFLTHAMDLITRVETRCRPWRPEEVLLGAECRSKNHHQYRFIITSTQHPQLLFDERELLNPDGTYSPCGVEEEV